ncbi:MAG TPA: ABC transporter ATP-binding protein [Methylomirabilota bacterium]|nr:ABC transporter ATP-binding protein [Methylomirabilota bacterium]
MDLSTDRVRVRFGGLVATDDVSIRLGSGEILGLIGPNGAGKTTLVNVLTGFQRPEAGSVQLSRRDMTGAPADAFARAGVVRTFQAVRLFRGMTLAENIEVGFVARGIKRSEARRASGAVLAEVGLANKAGEAASSLSYGEERRAGLARALALSPRFLLLDEPAAGLAAAEAEDLCAAIIAIRDRMGCGVLIIEHNMAIVMALCDRIHVLQSGRTIAEGPPDAIKADPAVRAAYLGSAVT